MTLRVLVAPSGFKESLGAEEVADCIEAESETARARRFPRNRKTARDRSYARVRLPLRDRPDPSTNFPPFQAGQCPKRVWDIVPDALGTFVLWSDRGLLG